MKKILLSVLLSTLFTLNSVAIPTGSIESSGKVTTPASTTDSAGFNIPSGTAPASPSTGDMYFNGTTVYIYTGSVWSELGGSSFPSGTQGDILYFNGSSWVALNAGTSGYFLKTQGAGANPIWAAGSGKLIVEGLGYGLDNSSTNRVTLGTGAVDLGYENGVSALGASGDYSVVGGGSVNLASEAYCTVSGGQECTASDTYATVGGGWGNTASASYSTISGGMSNIASAISTFIGGGKDNTASKACSSVSGGYKGVADHYGEDAYSSGSFTTSAGTCQRGNLQYRIPTSSTSATELFLNGAGETERFTISDGDVYSCKIHCMGVQDDGSACDAIYIVRITNQSGTTALSGSVRTLSALNADTNLGSPTFNITADDTNDSLKITVTPANTTATRWTAVVNYVKIAY